MNLFVDLSFGVRFFFFFERGLKDPKNRTEPFRFNRTEKTWRTEPNRSGLTEPKTRRTEPNRSGLTESKDPKNRTVLSRKFGSVPVPVLKKLKNRNRTKEPKEPNRKNRIFGTERFGSSGLSVRLNRSGSVRFFGFFGSVLRVF